MPAAKSINGVRQHVDLLGVLTVTTILCYLLRDSPEQ